MSEKIQEQGKSRRVIFIAVFAIIAAIVLLVGIRAAVSGRVIEAEDADLTSLEIVADKDSSNGSFIEFSAEDGGGEDPIVPDTVTYRITHRSSWSEKEGTVFPAGAHLSPTVAVAHTEENAFYTQGDSATPGFKIVAETGAVSTIQQELTEAGFNFIIGNRFDAPGENVFEIEISRDATLLSLVSMLAPSPDWVVGATNVQLYDKTGWLPELTVNLSAYDAGTDDGATFSAANLASDPQATIEAPLDQEFIDSATEGFGVFLFELVEVEEEQEEEEKEEEEQEEGGELEQKDEEG